MSSIPTGPGAAPATIEFNCTGCGRTLKVPASAAGRKASCPSCYGVVHVPVAPPAPQDMSSMADATVQPQAWPSQNSFPQASAPLQPMQSPQSFTPTPQPFPQAQPTYSPPASGAPAYMPTAPAPPPHAAPQAGIHLSPKAEPGRETPTKRLFDSITKEISKLYVGQDELVLGALVALFSNGHVLIESVPGLGKTLFVRTLGKVLGCQFGRIQFTADLMPSDITGAPIFDMKTQEFRFRPGPVFTQFLLADEINRAPAKTHAALLEIMQEYRVTIDGVSHVIERPFLVLATQNPIESEGTYNLPEAQLDRFMFKLMVNYPQETEEAQILQMHSQQLDLNDRLKNELQTITNPPQILQVIQENAQVRIDSRLIDYINKIVRRTREWPQFHMGASPRAGLALVQAARTLAAFSGRDYAVPDDVVQIALPALRHRVVLTAEAEVEGQKIDDLLTELIRSVEVPRL
jgi:MoxR-like ATPase